MFNYCPWDGYRFAENDVQCFICKRPKYKLSNHDQDETPRKKWEKILYEQQGYEDNYIDETFLFSVQREDPSSSTPDYRQLISKTSNLIFTINLVVLYLILYFLMLQNIVDEFNLIYIYATITITSIVYVTINNKNTIRLPSILTDLKSCAIYISILLLFAPVLQSVNQTYSDDTIYVLTSAAIIFYLFSKDYDYENVAQLSTWKVDSSNWASLLFTSLLASRLHNDIQVFAMFFGSNLLFIFAQFIKRPFREDFAQPFRLLNVVGTIILGVTLLMFSYFLALLYFGIVFFITFVSPLQLIWLYQYKNTIKGPWDLPNVKQYD